MDDCETLYSSYQLILGGGRHEDSRRHTYVSSEGKPMNSRLLLPLSLRACVIAGILCFTSASPILRGASREQSQMEKSLRDAFKGKTLSLRHFYAGSKIEIDSQGVALKHPELGPWTLYSRIVVDGIKLKSNSLEIDGYRLFLNYIPRDKEFRALREGRVWIRLELDHEPSSTQDLDPLLAKVFLRSGEDFSPLVPDYWKEFVAHMNDPDWSSKEAQKIGGETRRIAERWTPPSPIYHPEPSYCKEARDARINGTVVLAATIDESGHVSSIKLIRPLGMGLDESAVETVGSWSFEPAQFNGAPKAVRVVIEVTFRI